MSGSRWLSKPAVLWAIYEAEKVPPHLVAPLIVYATHTDVNGKGAYIAAATLAKLTSKTERAAKNDTTQLVQLGLIKPGDQSLATHIRRDRRPVVYDLTMPARGELEDTPSNGHGVNHSSARGKPQFRHGVNHSSPKEVLKTSGTGARAAANGAPRPKCSTCARVIVTGHKPDCTEAAS